MDDVFVEQGKTCPAGDPGVCDRLTENFQSSLALQRQAVLLVDDNGSCVQIFSEILEALGYTVRSASGGWEALDIFAEEPHRFSLVILDHVMPDLTGINTAQTLLQIRPEIPVMLITGWLLTEDAKQRAGAIGIRAILQKPINAQELSRTISGIIGEKKEEVL